MNIFTNQSTNFIGFSINLEMNNLVFNLICFVSSISFLFFSFLFHAAFPSLSVRLSLSQTVNLLAGKKRIGPGQLVGSTIGTASGNDTQLGWFVHADRDKDDTWHGTKSNNDDDYQQL
jgi:hypothetical protein